MKKENIYFWHEDCTKCKQSWTKGKTSYNGNFVFTCLNCDVKEAEERFRALKDWQASA